MKPVGVTEKSVLQVTANIEGSIRHVDGFVKYLTGWFGLFELPDMPGLSVPVKNFSAILRGFIDWNKGTYGALSRADEWLPDAKGKYIWERKGTIEVVNHVFMTVVSVFDVFCLCQLITTGAKLGFVAKTIHNGAFFGGMTFTFAGLIQPLQEARQKNAVAEQKLAKWRDRVTLYEMKEPVRKNFKSNKSFATATAEYESRVAFRTTGIDEKVAHYGKDATRYTAVKKVLTEAQANQKASKFQEDPLTPGQDGGEIVSVLEDSDKIDLAQKACDNFLTGFNKWTAYTSAKDSGDYSLLSAKSMRKVILWENQLTLTKNDVRGKWFDIAKTVAKAVQLIFALVILACGTVALPVLIADAVTKFALGHFAMASTLNKEFRPDVDYLPKDLFKKY